MNISVHSAVCQSCAAYSATFYVAMVTSQTPQLLKVVMTRRHHFFKVEFAIIPLHFGVWGRESYFPCYEKRSVA